MPVQQLINIIIKHNNIPITSFMLMPQSFYLEVFVKETGVIDVLHWAWTTAQECILLLAENWLLNGWKLQAVQSEVPIPARVRDLSLLQNVKKGS